MLRDRMRFGAFLAPVHAVGENPTVAFERDLELIQWLDRLGYDEAWIGEHHSMGWETIPSPELMIATAAERTKHIRLGTGVTSLPYHHPFMVASRIVFLDHLTRGRVVLGVGPGAFVSDAQMLGIDPVELRPRMAEALDVVLRLLRGETVTHQGAWFDLREAAVQLRSFQRPHVPVVVASTQSPAGMTLAGRYGLGVLSFGVFAGVRGSVDLRQQWEIAEQEAARHGTRVGREEYRIVLTFHLAPTREEALDDVRRGAGEHMTRYVRGVLGRTTSYAGDPDGWVEHQVAAGSWIIGTPDDAVAAIERFQTASGGFGAVMLNVHDWAGRDQTLRSFELFARHVMPRFQGSLVGLQAAEARATADAKEMRRTADRAIETAHTAYEKRSPGA